ncbi:ATP-binding protein [Desulfohalovibrio reitneri]|uniref:ATP-binding protein n=1 Tax=Desulfohalovibrio reitneri TaxID=1307759 RepID=UPI0004A74836|nr:ATP-binding protein [Desulfohalovibrio reitneri]
MKTLVVLSGKGGAGKTSVTAALAAAAARDLSGGVVLADCDVDAADLHLVTAPEVRREEVFIQGELASIDPDLCTQCGECLEHCRFHAVTEDFSIREEHCEGCGVCEAVCPSGAVRMEPRRCGRWFVSDTRFGPMVHAALDIGAENSGKLVTTVRKQADRLAEESGADLVLVDGSPGIGCPVIASLTGASAVLLVTEPGVAALHDLRRVMDLADHFRIPALAVCNKAGQSPAREAETEAYAEERGLLVAGRLPNDAGFVRAQERGLSVVEYDPEGLGAELDEIWRNVTSQLQLRGVKQCG